MDDDKFGLCGIIWIVCLFALIFVFRVIGLHIALNVILSLVISLAVTTWILIKWSKQEGDISYMIQVGVFWIFLSLDIDIIYDIEEYPNNFQSKEDLLTYSKQHKDVWAKLTKEQCNGKYSLYKYDTLPRGRVSYNIEDKSYNIIF